MTQSSKSKRLQAQLQALDNVLPASEVTEPGAPMPPKINEGDDRFGGYP
ncbi:MULTISPECIES: hypothetical protein [unclassified Corallococcus]|nr:MULTISPECIES: hypothetical protein [unclassified Corallococcus]MBN9687407.1 hypothetical protein [Corallococcus sp. NCSPR001]WAS88771.1 hypothetical protein O0N60_17700 [Corallococcus sp. NCRR]